MSIVGHNRSHVLPIRFGVFIRRFRIIRVAEAGVPVVEPGDLIADESRVGPTRTPENRFANSGGQDYAAVIRHVGTVSPRPSNAREGAEAPRPVDPEHRRFMLCVEHRQILSGI